MELLGLVNRKAGGMCAAVLNSGDAGGSHVMRELLTVLKALGERNRLRVLKMLEMREMCVREITEVLRIAQSAVSRHLKLLQEAGLVQSKRVGLWVYYYLPKSRMNKYAPILLAHLHEWIGEDPVVKNDKHEAERLGSGALYVGA